MSQRLKLALLGPPQIHLAGKVLTGFKTSKAQALLFYLAVTRQSHSRSQLASLLWGDMPEDRARVNLSKALSELRELIGQHVVIDRRQVGLNDQCDHWLDVAELEACAESVDGKSLAALLDATALYRGDFLAGFEVQNAPDFELWMLGERGRQREQIVQLLSWLVECTIEQRLWPMGIAVARRLLLIEPWREESHRSLMFLLARDGQRSAALAQYDICHRTLLNELGVEPDASTTDLYRRIRAEEVTADAQELVPSPKLHPNNEDLSVNSAQSSSSPEFSFASLSSPQDGRQDPIPFVGRKHEWQMLLDAWRKTCSGRSHFVLIQGDAGIGKTRLSEELLTWVHRQEGMTAKTRAYAAEGSLSYSPVVEWLRSPELHAHVQELDAVWQVEIARLLPELLIEHPDLPRPEPLTESWQRRRLFEALARAVAAEKQPKLLFFDDLQWCDQETLEWLRFLMRYEPAAPLLLVGTMRTGEVTTDHPLQALLHALQQSDQITSIALSHLDESATRALATRVNGSALNPTESERIYKATRGNPLFVVEMVQAGYHRNEADKAVPESQTVSVGLPPRVQSVIQARLAQLSPVARAIASLAATIGHSFDTDLLITASEKSESEVVAGLEELWQRRVVHETSVHRYDFSHDRIREVAYAEISPMQKRLLHRRLAQTLERLYANELGTVSGDLARHYEHAGQIDRAIQWHERAAQAARQLFAMDEAISHCRSALKLLQTCPGSDERARQKLHLLVLLAKNIHAVAGFTAPEYEKTMRQAYMLASTLKDKTGILEALSRLSAISAATGRCREAMRFADEALNLATETQNPILRFDALGIYIGALRYTGQFDQVEAAIAQASELYHRENLGNHINHRQSFGSMDIAWIDMNLRITRWLLGYPDQAVAISKRLLASTPPRIGVFELSIRHFFSMILYRGVGALDLLAPLTEQTLANAEQYAIPLSQGSGRVFRGWELAHQGRLHEGIKWTRSGVDIFREMKHTMFQTHRLAMLAEMLLWAQEWEEASSVLDEALAISNRADDHFWDVELYRLRGDLLLGRDELQAEAEASYERAIAIAQYQHAKTLELRATTALCRLWQRQGKEAQAYQRISELYNWFTEGFDTQDLRSARALLAQLSL